MNINELFPDKALAKKIERMFKFSKNPELAIKEMEIRSSLSFYSIKIENIEGLQIFKNLERLHLSGTLIEDLSPLGKLTNLRVLDLENNKIEDIKPLSKLTKLETLDLSRNKISDIFALSNLSELKNLSLRSNKIKDIFSLRNLLNLGYLFLQKNKIEDFSPLRNLKNLRTINLVNNKCTNVHFPKLSKLTTLSLGKECDLTTLAMLKNLENLDLGDMFAKKKNTLRHLSSTKLQNSKKLNGFLTFDNQLKDLSFFDNLPNLRNLTIYEQKRIFRLTLTTSLK